MDATVRAALIERLRAWLLTDEVRRSRLLWRLTADARLPEPWPYRDIWFDPAGAALLDLRDHPRLGRGGRPWFHADATDPAALEILCALRLPDDCEVLCDRSLRGSLAALGDLSSTGALEVWACAPGELGEAALPYEPTRLGPHHRALAVEQGWRPEDFADEIDEQRAGVRWAILREGHIVSRLLVQPVSDHVAEIADLHTRPDRRRLGYGAALVQAVVRRLHERGLTVTYSVHPSNEPSLNLARGIGFTYRFTWERFHLRRHGC